jgi:hypothetical protein
MALDVLETIARHPSESWDDGPNYRFLNPFRRTHVARDPGLEELLNEQL